MGVTIRKKGGKWYLFVNHKGKRKAKCVGPDRAIAIKVRQALETKLALGAAGIFEDESRTMPTFEQYVESWLKNYVSIENKKSTRKGYESVVGQYLKPRFAKMRLIDIKRDQIRSMISELIEADLKRDTIRNALAVIRKMLNDAIEDGILESNPAARMGRYLKGAKRSEKKGITLTPTEVALFLEAVKEVCPEYYPLFLMAVRAGLRRGELISVVWGDLQFGKNENDPNRFIYVQHNYVHREKTDPKNHKPRRVDMSKELRRELLALRDEHLLRAYAMGKTDISGELVFPSSEGTILDPDNLYHRFFTPALTKSGLRHIRLHDLRHTFGSLLIQEGASLTYVRDQMGHHSIQVTCDIYGHLVPSANVSYIDKLDFVPETTQQSATQAQPSKVARSEYDAHVVEEIGGGVWTRTTDLRIMRPSL